MAKKRTRKQKEKATATHVNSQLKYEFKESYNLSSKNESVVNTDKNNNLGSIKKELYKSLFIASLILISLLVVYWFSN
jgi:hypothetical protein